MPIPEVHYARSGDVPIAYQVVGSGGTDVVFARGMSGVTGIAVSIGARIASLAQPNEILVSSTVKDLVAGSELRFDDRGSHELKGVPGDWHVFAAT